MENTLTNFFVYFTSPSESELLGKFSTIDEAMAKIESPGMYWSKKLETDIYSCLLLVDNLTGDTIHQTLTQEEQNF